MCTLNVKKNRFCSSHIFFSDFSHTHHIFYFLDIPLVSILLWFFAVVISQHFGGFVQRHSKNRLWVFRSSTHDGVQSKRVNSGLHWLRIISSTNAHTTHTVCIFDSFPIRTNISNGVFMSFLFCDCKCFGSVTFHHLAVSLIIYSHDVS